jgi:hypothetical protein
VVRNLLASPGFWAMKKAIGSGYPATITTRSSRRSSISLTRVSTASVPYWSPARL